MTIERDKGHFVCAKWKAAESSHAERYFVVFMAQRMWRTFIPVGPKSPQTPDHSGYGLDRAETQGCIPK